LDTSEWGAPRNYHRALEAIEFEMFKKRLPEPKEPRLRLSALHAGQLCADGLAVQAGAPEFSKKPTEAWVETFTTLEGKSGQARQRFIGWTRVANASSKS
jgi:hypothetical protein